MVMYEEKEMKISNTYVSRPWLSIEPQTDGLILLSTIHSSLIHSFSWYKKRGMLGQLGHVLS
jgi:hypothetical protein